MFDSRVAVLDRVAEVATPTAARPGGLPLDPLSDDEVRDELWYEPLPSCGWWPEDEWDDEGEARPGAAPGEFVSEVEGVPPSALLALSLVQVDVETADEYVLVESVAAWERLAAWAHLNAALTAGELSVRAAMNPSWAAPVPHNRNVAGDELAMRLGWSRPAANRLVRDGRALGNELLPTADAVRAGRLDSMKLRVVTDLLADRPWQVAWPVQHAVLTGADTRTPSQLGHDVERALLTVEPAEAAGRLARAAAKRRVCHPKRLPDGMAGIWAVLPAADAVTIDAVLDASARAARALGDSRTVDQIRADDFVALATGRALLAGGVGTGVAGAGAPVTAGDVGDLPAPAGPTTMAGIRLPQVRVDVTVSLATLMGLDERPGELTGFGPIGAEQARALAADGVWRRLVTDPLTGRVLDVGRTRYRPPTGMAEHVMARDGTCAAPACSVSAHRCDIDHTTEYHGTPANGSPVRGTTSAGNLGPLSSRCHRLKTDGGFTLRQVEPGVFEWRTPAGLAYRVVPGDHGRTERLVAGAASNRNPGYPDEPPF